MPSNGNFPLFDRENMGIQLFMLSLSFPEALFRFFKPSDIMTKCFLRHLCSYC